MPGSRSTAQNPRPLDARDGGRAGHRHRYRRETNDARHTRARQFHVGRFCQSAALPCASAAGTEARSMTRSQEIEAQAAEWLMRREQPEWSQADQVALAGWLDESMSHKAAFWRLGQPR